MATRSGSSRRKPPVTRKANADLSDDEDDDIVVKNGTKTPENEEDDLEDLPEGTVVVQPEPVKENGKFSGPEFPSNKKKASYGDSSSHSIGRVTCTVCGDQINTSKAGSAKPHPKLGVLLCKSCCRYYKSGPISRDEDGLDEQCRWCSEGGKLFGCDFCHNAFCKACIMKNLGRSELSKLQQEDQRWKCYVCDPKPLSSLIETCQKVLKYMKDQVDSQKEKKGQKVDEPVKSKATSEKKPDTSINKKKGDKQNDSQSNASQSEGTKPTPSKFQIVYPKDNPITTTTYKASHVVTASGNANSIQRVRTAGQNNNPFFSFDKLHPGNVHSVVDKLISITSSLEVLLKSVKQNIQNGSVLTPNEIPIHYLTSSQLLARSTATDCIKSGVNLFMQEFQIATSKRPFGHASSDGSTSLQAKSYVLPKVGMTPNKLDAPMHTSTPKPQSKLQNLILKKTEDDTKKREADIVEVMEEDNDDSVIILSSPSPQKTAQTEKDGAFFTEDVEMSETKTKVSVKEEKNTSVDKGNKSKESDANSKVSGKEKDSKGKEKKNRDSDNESLGNTTTDTKQNESRSKATTDTKQNESRSKTTTDAKQNESHSKTTTDAKQNESRSKTNTDTKQNESRSKTTTDAKQNESRSKTTTDAKQNESRSKKTKDVKDKEDKGKKSDAESKANESGDKSKVSKKDKDLNSKKNDNENIAAQLELLEEMAEEILGNDSSGKNEDGNESNSAGSKTDKDDKSNDDDESDKDSSVPKNKKKLKTKQRGKNSVTKAVVENVDSQETAEKVDSEAESKKEDSENASEKEDSETEAQKEDSGKAGKKEDSEAATKKIDSGENDKKSDDEDASDSDDESSDDSDDEDESDDQDFDEMWSSRKKRNWLRKKNRKGKAKQEKKKKLKEKRKNEESDFDSELEDEIEKLAKDPKSKKKKAKSEDSENEFQTEKKGKTSKKEKKQKSSESSKKDKKKGVVEDSSDNSDDNAEDVEDDEDKTDVEDNPVDVPMEEYDENDQAKEELLKEIDEDEDDQDDGSDNDSSDSEVIITPRKTRNTRRKVKDDESETEEDVPSKKKRTRDSLLDAKLSDSDSDFQVPKKKGKKRKASSVSEKSSDSELEFIALGKKKGKKNKKKPAGTGKKRRRIKKASSSSDDEKISSAEEDADNAKQSDDDDVDGSPNKHKRKKIRKIKSEKKLRDDTKAAAKAEEERRRRIAEKQKEFNGIIQEIDESSPTKCPVTKQLVLEQDSETKKPILEVDTGLIVKLKPHQVEAVQFIWNCTMESLERSKKEDGSGCILAHCMGLGKTLTVITFVHTMLTNKKKTKLRSCLVVCPLNTVLNWENEFEMWQEHTQKEVDVYELSNVKVNKDRADVLQNWKEGGGVMIIGYDMFRNLTQGSHCKSKKIKAIFQETLVDPGPDLVVCDEGHILKNDQSAISKAMQKLKTRRRVVLTGTPLQNNLSEYHCMVDFVKPNLLGTSKEFRNRFVNPITNGQCSDSTSYDVKVMKRRAHILHEKLNGCVQRKDYSALTKFLSPKHEFVISVRLAKVQMDLYDKYLELSGFGTDAAPSKNRGARLFSDYQALMRIWTHPWVLKMDEIRQEEKRMFNDEDSFIDDDDYDEEKSSGSDQSDGQSSDDEMSVKSDDSAGPSSGRKSRSKAPEEGNEVVKKWKTRTRGGDYVPSEDEEPPPLTYEWWAEYVAPEDKFKIELGGKLVLLFEILKKCEEIGDKVLVFSQSLLSLDLIEAFLENVDQKHQEETAEKDEKKEAMLEEDGFGKHWTRGEDYFRMDGSTNAVNRKDLAAAFNDPENYRARLFLISTRAGGLGINLVAANRVIIFDASWNPSHDVQSIFRVYRFGQEKPVYVYRFLAQGTMEEKIYERQVTKQSLAQRVVDEHQIERHFSSADLSELYNFKPDRLDDPNRVEKTPILPKDTLLAELMKSQKDWIVNYHEHDSLLENKIEEELSEEERKAAWEEFENERTGINQMRQNVMGAGFQNMVNTMMMQPGNVPVMNINMGDMQSMAQMGITQQSLLRLVQEMKQRYPHLPQEQLTAQVQNVIRQMISRQIMAQQERQKRQMEAKEMQYQHRLRQIHSQIEQQQQQLMQSQLYGQPRPALGLNPAYAHLLRGPNPGMQNRTNSSENRASPTSTELLKQLQGSKPS